MKLALDLSLPTLGLLQGASSPLVNWGSSNFSFWKAARAEALAGTGRARILAAGDSTTAGVGAFTTAGLRVGGYPAYLASSLASAGLATTSANVVGSANLSTAASYTTYNPNMTFGSANWVFAGASAGGAGFSNATDTAAASFTPPVAVDTFEVTYLQNTGYGIMNYDIDGGTATPLNLAGTAQLMKVVISTTLGTHTLNLARASGGTVLFFAIVAYNSAQKAVDVMNSGWGGSTTADWNNNSTVFRARPIIQFYAPHLLILQLGINDYTPATLVSVANYQTNLNAIIADNIASRSILLVTPVPSISSRQTVAIQAQYVQAMRDVAAQNNLPLFDNWKIFDAGATQTQFYIADRVHPNETGYAREASALAPALMAA